MLIIAGGDGDPDLKWLADAAEHRGLPHLLCFCNSHSPSSFHWDLRSNTLTINGQEIPKEGACLYLRYSMYDRYGEDSIDDCQRLVESWYQTLKGWSHACPSVGMFNRHAYVLDVNKPYNLFLAQKCGFSVPDTVVLNGNFDAQSDVLSELGECIVKTPGDGEQTKLLSDLKHDNAHDKRLFQARPWMVQSKLLYPEMRIFQVGDWQFAFSIQAETLDSRVDDGQVLQEIDVPEHLRAPMRAMTKELGMDYAAADFKTCPKTGEYVFLEVNSAPTFSGYDAKAGGRLSDAMVLHLKSLAGL